jgi:hypothetical protein
VEGWNDHRQREQEGKSEPCQVMGEGLGVESGTILVYSSAIGGNKELMSRGLSASPLLNLPAELRRRIFEFVFLEDVFPRKKLYPNRLFGLVVSPCISIRNSACLLNAFRQGPQYKTYSKGGSLYNWSDYETMHALLISPQLYDEMQLVPFEVNTVGTLPVMGSNLASTSKFVNGLRPVQRRAIRKLWLHLLASVNEAWTLRSILQSTAGRGDRGDLDDGSGGSDLQELEIFITSRDLLLAQADSLTGLLHLLAVSSSSECSVGTAASCTASWARSLAHFKRLRRLTITIEASKSVLEHLLLEDQSCFEEHVQSTVSWVEVSVRWKPSSGEALSAKHDVPFCEQMQ